MPASTIATVAVAAQEPRHLLQRPLRRRQADSLHRMAGQLLQPLQRQRQVRAALGGGDGMDLVHDHRLDGAQHVARRRGQHQVQRLRRGDQDVGRIAADGGPLALRGVAAAKRDGGQARERDPGQRRAQVALDVVVERLQRRDVQHPGAALARGRGRGRPAPTGTRPASCPSRSAPAAACGSPRGDRGPAQLLGAGGLLERALEPVANRRAEGRQGVAAHTCNLLPGGRDSVPGVWTAVRFVHVLSAIAWVGVQLTLFMLFPVLRRQLEEDQLPDGRTYRGHAARNRGRDHAAGAARQRHRAGLAPGAGRASAVGWRRSW